MNSVNHLRLLETFTFVMLLTLMTQLEYFQQISELKEISLLKN